MIVSIPKKKASSPLSKVNKAQALLQQAFNQLKSQSMIDYVDLARAQIAVAYQNLEMLRVHELNAIPKNENALLELGHQLIEAQRLLAKQYDEAKRFER